jgi:PmbA protein
MNKENILSDLIDKAKRLGASDADAIIIDSTSLSTEVRLDKIINIERSNNISLGLRILINGKQAMVSTSDLSNSSINAVLESAIAMAKVTPTNPHAFLATSEQLTKNITDLNLYDSIEPTAEYLINQARETEQFALANKDITNSEGASSGYYSNKIYFATSNGFLHSYKSSVSSFSVSLIAGKDEHMQTDYAFSQARFAKDLKTTKEIGEEAASRTISRLFPKKIATCEMPVIFDNRVARSLLGAFASSVNGSSISRGTSFLIDHLGREIFNPNINIIDNPFILKALGSRPFDAEGISGSELKIIENGVLNNYFLDLQTSSKLKMQSTGHATRGLSSAPSPSSTNLYIEAGKTSLQDMIKSIKKGLLITSTIGHGANIITGEYSQGATGFYIENGEIAYPVSEITIAGNLKSMFKAMIPADDLKFESSINSPSLLIEKMTIAGV